MILAVVILVIFLISAFVITKLKNFNHKVFFIILLSLTFIATISVCIMNPKMHNYVPLNVIDYIIKFNTDGSMTTTKQVTTEVIKEVSK